MYVRWIRSYQDWRDAVPFTDAEVCAALREAAAVEVNTFMAQKRLRAAEFLERTGKLSSGMLGLALPFLVRVCDIVGPEGALCGKPALYRYGSHGRCRAHKALIPEESRRAYLQRDQNAGAKNALYRDADREQDARRAFHAACGRNNRRKP
jgi:hypothetical protein